MSVFTVNAYIFNIFNAYTIVFMIWLCGNFLEDYYYTVELLLLNKNWIYMDLQSAWRSFFVLFFKYTIIFRLMQ